MQPPGRPAEGLLDKPPEASAVRPDPHCCPGCAAEAAAWAGGLSAPAEDDAQDTP
jgi:hypothetical protein